MLYGDRWSHRAARRVLHGLGIDLPVSPLAHRGIQYRPFLTRLHKALRAEHYLEIGVRNGQSLKLARGMAVGVDPMPKPSIEVTDTTKFFALTSDDFFAREAVSVFKNGIDLAFIDGMHLVEFALRDFMNTERLANPGALVILHDCLPINAEMAARDRSAERKDHLTRKWWPGDVWKILPILSQYRPDLRITCLDCPPTGLVLVTGMDRKSKVLEANYDRIVSHFVPMSLDDYGFDKFRAEFPGSSSKAFAGDMRKSLASIGVKLG